MKASTPGQNLQEVKSIVAEDDWVEVREHEETEEGWMDVKA